MLRMKWRFAMAAWLAASVSSSWAAEARLANSVNGKDFNDPERLTAYEDSYLVLNQMRNNGWTEKDERALRAKMSFKYTFCGPQFRRPTGQSRSDTPTPDAKRDDSWCPGRPGSTWAAAEFYFGYTAEFDFYAGTRASGPVIGRVNAPGLFVRLPASRILGDDWKETDGLEVGLQHRSDGQATEVTSPRDAGIASEQYAAGNRYFFDTISRGANFLLVAADKELPPPVGEKLTLRAKLKLYLGPQDSDITWGPLANSSRRFSDYDRLQLQAWWRLSERVQVDLAWRAGDRGLATDSWTLGGEVNVVGIPVYLRVHRGPMNTLSNYTQRQDSIGFGIRFAGF